MATSSRPDRMAATWTTPPREPFRPTTRPPRTVHSGVPIPRTPKPIVGRARNLWASMPRHLADSFRPHSDIIAKRVLREIQEQVPEYAKSLEGTFGEIIVEAVRHNVIHCVDNVGNSAAPQQYWIDLCRNLGKVEFNEGRSLDSLQTAYRVGGRAAWRYIGDLGQSFGLAADTLCVAAEAIFAYVDEMSGLSVEGYTSAQTRAAGAIARRRRRLLAALLSTPATSPSTIKSMAKDARWTLPTHVTTVALQPRREAARRDLPEPDIGENVLVDLEGNDRYLLFPGSIHDHGALEPVLDNWRAVVGPRVPLSEAARSLHWARQTNDLINRGLLPDMAVTWCDDHLTTLWLLAEPVLINELINQALEPLAGRTPKQRARLAETLLVWLRTTGSAPEIAATLGIHPQTVRYRMHQIEELFGSRLNKPESRLDLEVALRAAQLLQRTI